MLTRRARRRAHGGEGDHDHAAERWAHDGVELLDAERAHGFIAGARDVLDGELREIEPVGLAGGRDSRDAGPVEPKQLPSEFTHTTK